MSKADEILLAIDRELLTQLHEFANANALNESESEQVESLLLHNRHLGKLLRSSGITGTRSPSPHVRRVVMMRVERDQAKSIVAAVLARNSQSS